MKDVLFITNIPAPYRIDFYNELGKYVNLTVLFEAKGASDQGIQFNWNYDAISNFKAVFLSNGDIREKKIDWKIIDFLKKNKFDYIVVTSYSYFTEMTALIYLKIMKIPYYMETDGGVIRNENKLKKWYKTFLIMGAKGYFSPSAQSDKYLVYYGANPNMIFRYPFTSLHKAQILENVLDYNEKIKIRHRLGMKGEKIVLGVGQMIYRKGWDILIKAASQLDEKIYIYIVGGRPTQEYLNLINKLKLMDKIHFIEFCSSNLLAQYYRAADLFVLPTREDIWGLVVNEALANGLPVITTNNCVAGLELVQNNINGRIIDVDSVQQLITGIKGLLYDSEYYNLSEAALESIKAHTIEEMAKVHFKVFGT